MFRRNKGKTDKGLTDYPEVVFGLWMLRISGPIVLSFGLCGNMLSLIVLQRKVLHCTFSALFLTALAGIDSLILLVGLLHFWTLCMGFQDFRDSAGIVCKLHTFILYTLNGLSAWILVAVTLQRLLTVYFPFRAKVVETRTVTRLSLILFTVILAGINSHFFWTLDVRLVSTSGFRNESKWQCTISHESHVDFLTTIWPWIDFIASFSLPFLTLVVGNSVIIYKLVSSFLSRRQMTSAADDNGNVANMTITLISINLVFLCLTSPVVIFFIGRPSWIETDDTQVLAKVALFGLIAHLCQYLNSAVNFLLYCVTGPLFRRELMKLFRCDKHKQKQHATKPELIGPQISFGSRNSDLHFDDTTSVTILSYKAV